MITSLYEQITDLYNNRLKDDWSKALLELGLQSYTKEIFDTYSDVEAKKIIAFIFYSYSLESKKLILKCTRSANQKIISDQLSIPQYILEDGLLNLDKECYQKLASVAQASSHDDEFISLLSMKKVREQLMVSSEEPTPKGLDQKEKKEFMKRKSECSLNALKLQKEIKILEESIKHKITLNENIGKELKFSNLTYEEILDQTEKKK